MPQNFVKLHFTYANWHGGADIKVGWCETPFGAVPVTYCTFRGFLFIVAQGGRCFLSARHATVWPLPWLNEILRQLSQRVILVSFQKCTCVNPAVKTATYMHMSFSTSTRNYALVYKLYIVRIVTLW